MATDGGKIITIDHGNTRAKVNVFDGDYIVASCFISKLSPEALLPLIEQHSPRGAIYSSVAHLDPKFIESLRYLIDGDLIIFTPRTPTPLHIKYDTPYTLGADRIAAAVGASAMYPHNKTLIIDAGTAITYDIVDGLTFLGGNISPGLSMRFQALQHFTGRLPLVKSHPSEAYHQFGINTEDAIHSGVTIGYLAEIEHFISSAINAEGVNKIIITGGDSDFIGRHLNSRYKYEIDRELVARGLNRTYLYNETL